MQRFLLPVLVWCFAVAAANDGQAENTKRSKGRPASNSDSMSVTPEREAAALTFVKQHHPELSELLVYLKKHRPKDYDKATRELFRTSERLARMKDGGDQQRYDVELKLWQLRSRAQLLSARLRTRPEEKLESELRSLLEKQYDLRLSQLEHERTRAAARLDKVNEQIEQFKSERQQNVDKQLRLLAGRKDKPARTQPTVTKRSTKLDSTTNNSDE